MEYVMKTSAIVEVTVKRTIKVGEHLNISPSYGYMDTARGEIVVTDLIQPDSVEEFETTRQLIQDFKDNLLRDTADYKGMKEYLDSTVWVEYVYTNKRIDSDAHIFPLDIFVYLTSSIK